MFFGIRDGKKSGSGINIPDPQHCLVHNQTPDFDTSIKETVIKPVRRAFNYIDKGSGDVP
jgi:hypothetical protein